MRYLPDIFANNRRWAAELQREHPELLPSLAEEQSPDLLWIGCSDSRIAATQICGVPPGRMFKHRNIANLVLADDLNAQAVIQYAVETLKIEHIIVCGHYRCGGVKAAMGGEVRGPLSTWLRPIRELNARHAEALAALADEEARWARLCELNVTAQVERLRTLAPVQSAWERGQSLFLHGWMYELHTGLLHDLDVTTSAP